MQRTKVICELCGQEISKSNYTKHLRRHQDHPETFKHSSWKLTHDGLTCQYCGKECKNRNSLCNHERLCSKNPNRQEFIREGFNNQGHVAWNKGLTKETNDTLMKFSEDLHRKYQNKELVPPWLGRKHTEETKEKISRARKDFLSQHPEKVPYVLNHSSSTSYPEHYFIELFTKENIDLVYHHRISKYELDFCDLDRKIDIEIDGDQHYLDKRIRQSDIERDNYLQSLGWKVVRIKWSDYQRLSIEDRRKVIEEIRAPPA